MAHLVLFAWLFATFRGSVRGGDSAEYLRLAEGFRSGGLLAQGNNAKPLGYPLLIASAGWLPGGLELQALAVNWLAFFVTVAVVGALVRRLGGSWGQAGFAQCVCALIPNLAAWANLVESETVTMALLALCALLAAGLMTGTDRPIPRVLGLGAVLGLAALTRTEMVLLLPVISAALLWRSRGQLAVRWSLARVAMLWAAAVPALLVQPIVSGWSGRAQFIPPGQQAFCGTWHQADLAFTQLRFHRLVPLAQWASEASDEQLAELPERLRAISASTANGSSPVPPVYVETVESDVQEVRRHIQAGRSLDEGFRAVTLRHLTEDPWGWAVRVLRRLVLYLAMADLDWPWNHPAHWLYTVVALPVSVIGYGLWIRLVRRAPEFARPGLITVVALGLFPILVHSMFFYEQRFAQASLPLLCVAWGLAWSQVRIPTTKGYA